MKFCAVGLFALMVMGATAGFSQPADSDDRDSDLAVQLSALVSELFHHIDDGRLSAKDERFALDAMKTCNFALRSFQDHQDLKEIVELVVTNQRVRAKELFRTITDRHTTDIRHRQQALDRNRMEVEDQALSESLKALSESLSLMKDTLASYFYIIRKS